MTLRVSRSNIPWQTPILNAGEPDRGKKKDFILAVWQTHPETNKDFCPFKSQKQHKGNIHCFNKEKNIFTPPG